MPTRIDPLTIRFHAGDVLTKLMELYGVTQTEIADRIGRRPNTVSDYIGQKVKAPDPEIWTAILAELRITPDELEALLARLNGEPPASLTPRTHLDRIEDRNPRLKDAREHGERIAALPEIAQYAIFHLVRVLESAFRDTLRPIR